MTASVLIKMLESAGWYQSRQRGSHRIFKHELISETIVVPDHGSRDLGKGLVNDVLKKAGLK